MSVGTLAGAPRLAQVATPRLSFWARLRAIVLRDGFILGTLITLAFSGVGVWMALVQQSAPGDALSRTYSAAAVLYAHDPHLATLGFIWPPLPAFAQIIVLRIAPGLAYYGLSGNIVTAVFAGGLAAVLLSTLKDLGLGRWASIALVVAVFLNPMMACFASNGMSEMPFLLFLTLAVVSLAKWSSTGRWQPLALSGFSCAAMFFCRYDAAVVAPAIALCIPPVMRLSHREFFPPKVEANLLAFTVPVAYVGFIWVYLNRLIMGSALYFWNSEYSNLYLTRDLKFTKEVVTLQQSLLATAKYFATLVAGFSPLFLAACALALIVAIWRRDVALLAFAAILLAAPVFQLYEYRAGSTFKFNRFYISVIVSGLLLGAYTLRSMWGGSHKRATFLLLLAGLLAGNVVSWNTIVSEFDPNKPDIISDEGEFVKGVLHPTTPQGVWTDDARAAAYLNDHVHDRSVVIDAVGANVALFTGHLGHFYLPSDSDWKDVATKPEGRAQYLVAVGNTNQQYHAFDDIYPGLFENGTSFTTLEGDFGTVRIYRVNG